MKTVTRFVAALALAWAWSANAAVLGFDDVSTAGSGKLGPLYGGFFWSSHQVISDTFFQSSTFSSFGSPSGEYAAFTSGDEDGSLNKAVSRSTPFDFNGASFASYGTRDDFGSSGARSLTIEGYNGSILVDSHTFDLSADRYTWERVDMEDVTKLVFLTPAFPNFYLMDDFTFDEAIIDDDANVPAPASIALIGLGLFGLRFRRKT